MNLRDIALFLLARYDEVDSDDPRVLASLSGGRHVAKHVLNIDHQCRFLEGTELARWQGVMDGLDIALRCLAKDFAWHPEYRDEWGFIPSH